MRNPRRCVREFAFDSRLPAAPRRRPAGREWGPRSLSNLRFPLLRNWQKPRFLPAETKLMSEKAPQATFSDELGGRAPRQRDGTRTLLGKGADFSPDPQIVDRTEGVFAHQPLLVDQHHAGRAPHLVTFHGVRNGAPGTQLVECNGEFQS